MASIYNSTTYALGANGQFNGSYEKLSSNIESISVLVKSDVDGEVSIYFANSPSDPVLYRHTYQYDHTQEFHRVVSKKGLYMRVNYINGPDSQTTFQLITYLKTDFEVEQTTEGGNDVNITNESIAVLVENEYLGVVVEGMNFTPEGALIVSGPTGGISGPVEVYGTVGLTGPLGLTGYALESTLSSISTELTSNMPTKLVQEQTGEEVYTIRSMITPLQHETSYYNVLTDSLTLGADSNPAFTSHPTGLNGWYYRNTAPSGASNLYFYGKTAQTRQATYTISQLMNSYVVVKIFNLQNTNNLPFLVVYSAPTGSGDYAPWYKSKWVYKIPADTKLDLGMEFLLYQGEMPNMKIHPNLRRVEATLSSSFGPAQTSETLLFCTVNTDSSATINSTQVLYSSAGITTASGLIHDLTLGYGYEDKTRAITTEIQNLNSTIGSGVFVQLDGTISGQKIKSSRNDGSADVNVVNNITVDSSTPLNTVLLAKYGENNAFLTVDNNQNLNVKINAGSLSVSGSTVGLTGPIGLTGPVELKAGSVVGITGTFPPIGITGPTESRMYASSNGSTWHHVASDANGQLNVHSKTQDGAGNDITSTSASGTEIYTALDVKVKGTTTISGGVSATLSTQDNGQLTSTLSGSGNSIHSLDVAVKNNVSVQNVSSTKLDVSNYAIQYGSYANLVNNQTILPYTASSSLDVSLWSYYMGFYSSSFMGFPSWPQMYRIQYSFDNITFYNMFNTSVSPSSAGGLNVATIYKQDIPGINYLRFYNDSTDTLTNVNITILGASSS